MIQGTNDQQTSNDIWKILVFHLLDINIDQTGWGVPKIMDLWYFMMGFYQLFNRLMMIFPIIMGVPPVLILFSGIFQYKPSILVGYQNIPYRMGPPSETFFGL